MEPSVDEEEDIAADEDEPLQLIENEDILSEPPVNEEEDVTVDDEGDVEVFVERESDSSGNDEDLVDSEGEMDQDNDQILSQGGISYTPRPIPRRRHLRNVITETARAVVRLQSEKESLKCLVSEETLRKVLMHTYRKMQQIQRNLRACYSTNAFSMEELKADIAIVLRAGRDRDNFSDLNDLWNPSDSRPFYRTLMPLNRLELLLRCLCVDNWHTRDERKRVDKFATISKIWHIFLRNARRVYIPGECITASPLMNSLLDTVEEFLGEHICLPSLGNMG